MLERVPPEFDAERSALGAMFDKEAFNGPEILRPDDFYKDAHRHIYQTVLDLANKGEPVDLVTVTEALRQNKRLDEVGGVTYLTELANAVPTAAHIDHYARIVEEKSLLRQLIHAAGEIMAASYESREEVEEILDEAERRIFSANRRSGRTISSLKQILIEALNRSSTLYETKAP